MTPPSTTRFTDPDPGIRVLMGPGPSDVPARVLQAMASPTIGHLDPYFLKVMEETQELLRRVFRTENQLTIPVSDGQRRHGGVLCQPGGAWRPGAGGGERRLRYAHVRHRRQAGRGAGTRGR